MSELLLGVRHASLCLARRVLQNSWQINIEAFTTTSLSASTRTRAYAACAMLVSPRDVERRMRCIAAFHARLRSILSSIDHYGYRKKCITLLLRKFSYIVKSGIIFLIASHQANIKIVSVSLLKKI